MTKEDKKEVILDSDFTPQEHAEFEKLEADTTDKEIKEETIRIPKRPEKINDTKNDMRFLTIFCILAAIALIIVIIMAIFSNEPKNFI